MSAITYGRYKVLRKVSKICNGQDEKISLLRNTAFSKLRPKLKYYVDSSIYRMLVKLFYQCLGNAYSKILNN